MLINNPTLIWLIAGALLCFLELIFPTAFVQFIMGVSALIVAVVSLVMPQVSLQVTLWLFLSTVSVILSRYLFKPQRKNNLSFEDAREGETLTEIPPGKEGRVLYEGNSWRAKCDDQQSSIAPGQKVYIIRRQGTTLIVMAEEMINSTRSQF